MPAAYVGTEEPGFLWEQSGEPSDEVVLVERL